MDSNNERPKAYLLLSVLGGDMVRIPVDSSPYTIGRAKSCNYCIPNKIISGQHCCVSHDEEKDCFFLEDTSTNGMLVNKTLRTTKGQKVPLKNGDKVFLVYRKLRKGQADVISFQFEEVSKEGADVDLDQTLSYEEAEEDSEATQEYLSADVQKDDGQPDGDKKRKRDEDDEISSGGQSKKPHVASEGGTPVTEQPPSEDAPQPAAEGTPSGDAQVSVDKSALSEDSKTEEEGGVKLPTEREAEDTMDESQDEMMETLICSICQDILHDCVSLQPCMHTFCAACYSQWMDKSSRCPTCRKGVKRVSKNHIVNNLVEAYLKNHPEKKRSKEEIDEMNARNKIKSETFINPRVDEEDFSDDSGDEYNSSSEAEGNASIPVSPFWGVFGNIIGRPMPPPPVIRCRQCPGTTPTSSNNQCAASTPSSSTNQCQPSSSSGPSVVSADGTNQNFRIAAGNVRVLLPTAPPFVCRTGACHLMCHCCRERFPDRRGESNQNLVPPFTCTLCQLYYCHMYWGCKQNNSCFGCLNKFKDLHFGDKCTESLILGNMQESSIFKKYLQQKNLTWKNVLDDCLMRLERGDPEYQTTLTTTHNITRDSVLCYSCGMKVFKELAYPYREKIPRDQLPAEALSRPDCYWGKNCRTQFNKPAHAARFNHVCNQTRF